MKRYITSWWIPSFSSLFTIHHQSISLQCEFQVRKLAKQNDERRCEVSLSEIMQQLRKIQGGGPAAGDMAVWRLLWNSWHLSSGCPLQHWNCRVTVGSWCPGKLPVQIRWDLSLLLAALHHTTTTGLCQSAGTAQPAAQDSRLTRSQLSQTGDQIRVWVSLAVGVSD